MERFWAAYESPAGGRKAPDSKAAVCSVQSVNNMADTDVLKGEKPHENTSNLFFSMVY